MKLFAILSGAAIFAIGAADTSSTSVVSTLTSTRTVVQVSTAIVTGTPPPVTNSTTTSYSASGYSTALPYNNATSTASSVASPSIQSYSPSGTNAAAGLSVDLSFAAVVAAAALLVF